MHRLPNAFPEYQELKDPSIVEIPGKGFELYASVGSSVTQQWKVGRFYSQNPEGPWQEMPSVEFQDIEGTQVCAPAMEYVPDDTHPWKMYIQTSCFDENGVIVKASSADGQHFIGEKVPHITRVHTQHALPSVGVYDAGISEIEWQGERYRCLLFSGYRRIGCGDLYLTLQRSSDHGSQWERPISVLKQEDVPFHNPPDGEDFEWGLEGAKLVQLKDDLFLLIGVSFLPLPKSELGTRQRVFFALSSSPYGPFHPWSLPLATAEQPLEVTGEHGHPDMLLLGDQVWMWYQKREGANHPWYLKSISWPADDFIEAAEVAYQELTQTEEEVAVSPVVLPWRPRLAYASLR